MARPLHPDRRSTPDSLTEQVLTQAQSSREVIQDFVPLADSLEWDLGQQYLRQRGNKAFISDASPVPYVVNNDGTLSRHAAEVFFASLVEAEKAGPLPRDLHVLELGIGVGLFARYFLDHFQELCRREKKDFYQRLTYIAADRSERMLSDVLLHGVLAKHPGRVRVRLVDAMRPDELLPRDVSLAHEPPHPRPLSHGGERGEMRAVFLNYLLDCLPAASLRFEGEKVEQLHVRTCVARSVQLSDYTDLTAEQLRKRAASSDPKAKQELLEVYGLMASEYDYRPVELQTLPYGEFAAEYARRTSKRLLHSHGAIRCLEKLLELVADDGFILVNDYGSTQSTGDSDFEHQRFSLATFVGVNFPLLEAYFGRERGGSDSAAPSPPAPLPRRGEGGNATCKVVKPAGDGRGIHSRLFSRVPGAETITRFYECFSDGAHEKLQTPIDNARGCAKAGRFELAASYYQEALQLQPRNWVLLNEVSQFLTFSMRDPKAGANLAKIALGLNPTCSAELWSTLGDALYEWGRTAEARGAYEKALSVNAADVRARYNLAWVHVREKNFDAALKRIAEAFTLDKTGEYRERLVQKLQEILQRVSQRHQQEYLLLTNLVSRYAKNKKDTGTPAGEKQS